MNFLLEPDHVQNQFRGLVSDCYMLQIYLTQFKNSSSYIQYYILYYRYLGKFWSYHNKNILHGSSIRPKSCSKSELRLKVNFRHQKSIVRMMMFGTRLGQTVSYQANLEFFLIHHDPIPTAYYTSILVDILFSSNRNLHKSLYGL